MSPGRYPYAGPRETSRGAQIDLRQVENGYLVSCTIWPEEEDAADYDYLPEELQRQQRYHPPSLRRYVFTSRGELLAWLGQQLLEEKV
ncbi:MAG: hypothetical protein JKY65_28155 [Planctomycetes bacterium]|nr:hypothetical protein [Planctomycetota bacterium]